MFIGKPEGSVFTASGYHWIISYAGGSVNDVVLTIATAQQSWRYQHFATIASTGTAADLFDGNADGEVNLMEFATAQNPHVATSATPTLVKNSTTLEFTYTRSLAALGDGTIFTVEWSATLANDWSAVGVTAPVVLSDNGTVQQVKVTLPAGTVGRRFVHLKISR
jgi:hypothetical protein